MLVSQCMVEVILLAGRNLCSKMRQVICNYYDLFCGIAVIYLR